MTSYQSQPDTTTASPPIPSLVAFRLGRFSTVVNRSFIVGLCLLLVLILLLCAVSLGIGDYPLSPLAVIKVLLGDTSSPIENLVVWKLRMPRTLSALAVGLLLGIAGALTQSVTRNPLASPDILGITSGASVAAVSVIVLAPQRQLLYVVIPWWPTSGSTYWWPHNRCHYVGVSLASRYRSIPISPYRYRSYCTNASNHLISHQPR